MYDQKHVCVSYPSEFKLDNIPRCYKHCETQACDPS
jgi:hypothetical protein